MKCWSWRLINFLIKLLAKLQTLMIIFTFELFVEILSPISSYAECNCAESCCAECLHAEYWMSLHLCWMSLCSESLCQVSWRPEKERFPLFWDVYFPANFLANSNKNLVGVIYLSTKQKFTNQEWVKATKRMNNGKLDWKMLGIHLATLKLQN